MKEILESIILNIVTNKEAVNITETQKDDIIEYQIKVANEDMGRVIGKQGRLAKSIRVVAKAIANREHKKVEVEFVD